MNATDRCDEHGIVINGTCCEDVSRDTPEGQITTRLDLLKFCQECGIIDDAEIENVEDDSQLDLTNMRYATRALLLLVRRTKLLQKGIRRLLNDDVTVGYEDRIFESQHSFKATPALWKERYLYLDQRMCFLRQALNMLKRIPVKGKRYYAVLYETYFCGAKDRTEEDIRAAISRKNKEPMMCRTVYFDALRDATTEYAAILWSTPSGQVESFLQMVELSTSTSYKRISRR